MDNTSYLVSNYFKSFENLTAFASKGTNFADGLKAGDFPLTRDNDTGRGVLVGNLLPYAIKPLAAATLSTSTQVNSRGNQTYFFPLAYDTNICDVNAITIDVPRTLAISSTILFSNVIVSGFDYLRQKMVCSGNPTLNAGTYTFQTARAFKYVTSISYQTAVSTFTLTLSPTNQFEIPYSNFATPATLLTANFDFTSLGNGKYASRPLYTNSGGKLVSMGTITDASSEALQPNYLSPRTLFDTGSNLTFDGIRQLTFLFVGYFFPTSPDTNLIDVENWFAGFQGIPNYVTGWQGNLS
jgi:hypothetical protein